MLTALLVSRQLLTSVRSEVSLDPLYLEDLKASALTQVEAISLSALLPGLVAAGLP